MKKKIIFVCALALIFNLSAISKNKFKTNWLHVKDRVWAGPDFWANRLQDWGVKNHHLECLNDNVDYPMRTVHILTHGLKNSQSSFNIQALLSNAKLPSQTSPDAAVGIVLGAGVSLDYRAVALIHCSYGKGAGIFIGFTAGGKIVMKDMNHKNATLLDLRQTSFKSRQFLLNITGSKHMNRYVLQVMVTDTESNQSEKLIYHDLQASMLSGGIALVSHPGTKKPGGRFRFNNLSLEGDRIQSSPSRHCGPILSSQYTLSQNTLKMTAQLLPIGEADRQFVALEILAGSSWNRIREAKINSAGYIACFKIKDWDDTRDHRYRLKYSYKVSTKQNKPYMWEGTIRKSPVNKNQISVAAFTGNHNVVRPNKKRWGGVDVGYFPWDWGVYFPHNRIVKHVTMHAPDLLFFSGDQVYEGASPTRADFSQPELDYLYKWYLWCWAFRDLTASIPCVCIPDDHDVYHGNLWGAGGKATIKAHGAKAQDSGGYKMTPGFVNMVQATQTSHLPDPFDPTPVKQGIGVYFCELNWGWMSFAVIEDRKFKSAPKPLLPGANVWNGWAQNKTFNAKIDANGATADLLGERQLHFLNQWATNWHNHIYMKTVLSATIFANVATLPAGAMNGSIIPKLKILPVGEYADNDLPVADMDSNGWPQRGRNKAIKEIRKGFAFHIAGDQHLGSTIQYGTDTYSDSGFALCVPSISNFWPRRWFPSTAGGNRQDESPIYTGDHEDGFGNKMTVYAVSNPHKWGKFPEACHDLSPGYGIVKFNKKTRKIVIENWPIWSDPTKGGTPYPGWPVIISQFDNYGRKPYAFLPEIKAKIRDPLITVKDDLMNQVVYTIRNKGSKIRAKVFKPGIYTLIIAGDTKTPKSIKNILIE